MENDIQILVAGGTHRPPTEREYSHKIFEPDFYLRNKDKIFAHNCDKGNIEVGITSFGTPVGIDEKTVNSCLLIPLTDSELHYFAGVAGTVKQIIPGIAARKTVNFNHTKMFDKHLGFVSECRLANTEGNLVITEIKEIAEIVKEKIPIFGIDVIFFGDEIVYMNAGDLLGLHNHAVPVICKLRTVEVTKPGDLVIVSVGNLGINLYQAGKGIHAGWNAVRKDGKGKILVLAPCPDQAGYDADIEAMYSVKGKPSSEALDYILTHYCSVETFKIGNQKPVDLLRIMKDVGEGNLMMITEMDEVELRQIYRISKVPWKGSATQSLRDYLGEFFQENLGKDTVVYIISDPATYVKIVD